MTHSSPGRSSKQPGVLVILPVLNEESNIDRLLHGLDRELATCPHDICLIDDGSTDQTVPTIRAAMRSNPQLHLIQREKKQRGSIRGSALRAGLQWGLDNTQHAVFVEMDGDLSHRVEELHTGISLIQNRTLDVAIASKYVQGSEILDRPFARRMVSRVCSWAVSLLITRRIRDYSNGYRFYHRDAAALVRDHKILYASPIYLTEVLALWLRSGLLVGEFPSTYVGRQEGLSKLRFTDLAKAAVAIFEIAFRYHYRGFAPQAPTSFRHPNSKAA